MALVLPRGQDRRDRGQRVGQEHAVADHGGDRDRLYRDARPASGIKIGYLPQEPMLDPTLDVRGNVELAVADVRAQLTRFDEINGRLGDGPDADEMDALLEEQARVQDAIEASASWDLDRSIEIAMDAMRLPPGDAPVSTLSGGERRRVALCKILLERPDLLLLDEPTNHLDAESVAWLERHLQEYAGTVVLVTHDRYFLDNVARWILELDRGRGIPWEGNYSSWLEQKQARLSLEEKQESSRRKQLARELEWVRMSPRAGRQEPRADPALRATGQPGGRQTRRGHRAPDPPWPASGHAGGRGPSPCQKLWRQLDFRNE